MHCTGSPLWTSELMLDDAPWQPLLFFLAFMQTLYCNLWCVFRQLKILLRPYGLCCVHKKSYIERHFFHGSRKDVSGADTVQHSLQIISSQLILFEEKAL